MHPLAISHLMTKFVAHISMHLVLSMTPPWQFGHRSMNRLKQFTGMHVKKYSSLDSAFASKKSNAMLKLHQNNVDTNGNHPQQRFYVNCEVTSIWQLSEWGVRCLQGSFPKIKDKFLYKEKGKIKLIINTPKDWIALQLLGKQRWSEPNCFSVHALFDRNANRYNM